MAAGVVDERGYFGLRSINNNRVFEGGRDFIMAADPGYNNGRLTPKMRDNGRDCTHVPAVKRGRCKMPLRQPAHSQSTGSIAMFDGSKGQTIRLRPAVQARWENAHNDPGGRVVGKRRSPDLPDFIARRAPLPGDADDDASTPAFKDALDKMRFTMNAFPVPKYRQHSQPEPHAAFDGRGDHHVEHMDEDFCVKHMVGGNPWGAGSMPKLSNAPIEKYMYYSCPIVTRSPSYIPDHHNQGLNQTKKTHVHDEPYAERRVDIHGRTSM